MVSNSEVAKVLYLMSEYLDMEGVAFKPRAYEKVAQVVEAMEQEVSEIYKQGGLKALENVSGIGKGIAGRIEEFLKTGKIADLEKLKKKTPVDLKALTAIEGIGPKMIKRLYEKLKVRTLGDLEKAARAGKIRSLEGFGQKSEENILKGIEFVKQSSSRFILGFIEPLVKEIEQRLANRKEAKPGSRAPLHHLAKRVVVAGSYRRKKETIGDIDILAISDEPQKLIDFFVSMPEMVKVYAHGDTKGAVRIKEGIDVDLRVVPQESFGAALNYFTGSKDHNVALRNIAIKKGYKLNEYGLYKSKKQIAGKTEEELYEALGINQYIPPELREMRGEIETAKAGKLPKLVEYGSIQGDLQVQTNWTDGSNSIEDMAKAAKKAGLKYICITDHTKSLAMTGGQDEHKLLKQWTYIDNLNKNGNLGIKILKGAEVNIMKDGSLDIKNEVLAKGDVIGIAVHSLFNMSKQDMTERIKKAMSNPQADILFHPTGRLINKREPYQVDIEEVIAHAKKTGTILEIDAYPSRLDLKDEHIRMAVQVGCKLSIDTDAHHISHFQYLDLGVSQAQRGWAKASDVINTRSWPEMLKLLK